MAKMTEEMIEAMDHEFTFVPHHIRRGIKNYIENKTPLGGFLSSMLRNDLEGTLNKADGTNQKHIYSIYRWFYNYAPAPCMQYDEWIKEWMRD